MDILQILRQLWFNTSTQKKHPEFNEHQKLRDDIIKGLESLTANGGVEEAKIALTPSEEYLKKILDNYTSSDKNHIKMRFIAYYDLALIYAHTDRLGLAKDMISKAISNDYEKRDCRKLLEWIEEQESQLQANNMTSLHFPLPEAENIDEDHPAQWILAIRAEEARIAAEAAAAARQAELNADEYLGEISIEPISPTRIKVVVTVVNEQVKERVNTVKLIVKDHFFNITNPNYLHDAAVANKNLAKCNIADFAITENGTKLTTVISGLEIGVAYSVIAYTNWNGVVKYTRDAVESTHELAEGWVDMGLSVKWAACNMGAKKPGKLGDLYTWYDTKPYKEKETVPNNIPFDQLPQSVAGDPQHDAARAFYGEGAQIPSLAQWQELYSNCEIKQMKYNREFGFYFESPITNQGLFIPFTGFVSDSAPRGDNNYGLYWTCEKSNDKPETEGDDMNYIRSYGIGHTMRKENNTRYYGKLHLRAVKK